MDEKDNGREIATCSEIDMEESTVKEPSPDPTPGLQSSHAHLAGWRFWFTMAGLYLGLFLVTLEMTVVSTALVTITDDLGDFLHATWIINAYFLTWSGVLIIWSQFSHTAGRKPSLLIAMALFILFSTGCAAAQNLPQLIILRAFQGLAAAGVFTLPISILSEAVSPSVLPKTTAFMALVSTISFAIGPLIGGVIAAKTTWRWIFILNIPVGALAFIMDLIALPNAFPHHLRPKGERKPFHFKQLKQLDLVGGALFVGVSIPLVTVLQEVDTSYSWNSAFTICLLVLSAICTLAFVSWEFFTTYRASSIFPLLTWKLFQRRPLAMFLSSFLIGIPFTTTLVQIPQRLQVVDGLSSLEGGVRLLPFIVLVSIGTALGSLISQVVKTRLIYGMMFGSVIQLVAVICFVTMPLSNDQGGNLPASQYIFQVLLGLGNGISYTVNFNGMPYVLDGRKELVAPAMGANAQFRYLGGAIGLGAVTAGLNSYLRAHLANALTTAEVEAVLQSANEIVTLDAAKQDLVLQVFANGFALQWKIVCGFAVAQLLAVLLTL